jgi:Ca2+-binding EF-hand superfamily protein
VCSGGFIRFPVRFAKMSSTGKTGKKGGKGGSSVNPEEQKKVALEVRGNIRSYIQNERDTILRKWQCLQESLNSEEKRKEEFLTRQEVIKTRAIPEIVQKFIRTLKRSIRNTITTKGGTPYSIVRSMFLYWDRDKSGELGKDELNLCMSSLGVKITERDIEEIIRYYDSNKGNNEMAYNRLLADIQYDEPSIIAEVIPEKDLTGRDEDRFQTHSDQFTIMPSLVSQFIDAVRSVLHEKMRTDGGTELSHLRHAFLMFDHDYSSALDVDELLLSMHRNMGLVISREQAEAVVKFYDRKNSGQMSYQLLLEDVIRGQPLLLQHPEITSRTLHSRRNKLKLNPFIPKPFIPFSNKIIERIKIKIRKELDQRIRYQGGSVKSWIRKAFMTWDPEYCGFITNWNDLQGAIRHLGVNITEEEAKVIMHAYDKTSSSSSSTHSQSGKMDYNLFQQDLLKTDPTFLMDSTSFIKKDLNQMTATGRTPTNISMMIRKIRRGSEVYCRKSDGSIEPRDLLHGTLLRFDTSRTGKISIEDFIQAMNEIRVPLSRDEVRQLVLWFDSNGTERMDYSLLVCQLYGEDILTRPLSLPALPSHGTMSGASASTSASVLLEDRNEIKQSLKQAAQKKLQRNKMIIAERVKVQAKLESIEKQRQALVDHKRLAAATAARHH